MSITNNPQENTHASANMGIPKKNECSHPPPPPLNGGLQPNIISGSERALVPVLPKNSACYVLKRGNLGRASERVNGNFVSLIDWSQP